MKRIFKILHSVLMCSFKLGAVALFCLGFSFIFVYPLWLFAVKQPDAFSFVVLILCILALGTAFFLKIKPGKKK